MKRGALSATFRTTCGTQHRPTLSLPGKLPLWTALEGGNGPADVEAHGGAASVEQQKSGHGGERTIAGGGGLQSGTRRYVPGRRRANIEPRQLSFSFVQSVVEAALPGLDRASCEEEYEQRLERMLRFAAQGKLPRRTRNRSYPREVWGRGAKFPARRRNAQSQGEAK
jgi:hypothetical protein